MNSECSVHLFCWGDNGSGIRQLYKYLSELKQIHCDFIARLNSYNLLWLAILSLIMHQAPGTVLASSWRLLSIQSLQWRSVGMTTRLIVKKDDRQGGHPKTKPDKNVFVLLTRTGWVTCTLCFLYIDINHHASIMREFKCEPTSDASQWISSFRNGKRIMSMYFEVELAFLL